jgi:hypothetical protein
MLTLRDHRVSDYEALLDMDTTDVRCLSNEDRLCLDALGQYLVDTETYDRFSIWLLHKHFHPRDGEVFCERVLLEERARLVVVTRPGDYEPESLTPTALRFDSDSSALSSVGMEFALRADLATTRALSESDEKVLSALRDILTRHGKVDRFGVRLIHDPLNLAADEVLVETCNLQRRLLRCDVAKRAALPTHAIIETAWQWRPQRDALSPNMLCRSLCTQVCLDNHDERGHQASGHTAGYHSPTEY